MQYTAALYDLLLDTGWNGLFINTPVLEIYGGTQPEFPELAVSGSLDHFMTISLASPPWLSASGGVKAKNGTWSDTFSVGGTPTWFRLRNSAEAEGEDYTVARIDGSIGTSQDKDVLMSKATWIAGETLVIENFTLVASFSASMGLPGRGNLN